LGTVERWGWLVKSRVGVGTRAVGIRVWQGAGIKDWKGMTKYGYLLKRLVNKGRSVLKELHEEVKLSRVGGVGQKERSEGKVRNS